MDVLLDENPYLMQSQKRKYLGVGRGLVEANGKPEVQSWSDVGNLVLKAAGCLEVGDECRMRYESGWGG